MNSILICGSSGFIGKRLRLYFSDLGYLVKTLDRKLQPHPHSYIWDPDKDEYVNKHILEGIDTVINLVGANIGEKRWSKNRKKTIQMSRIQPANVLYNSFITHQLPLTNYISASAVGYYGAISTDYIYNETDIAGNDFLGQTCEKWEQAAQQFSRLGARVITLRKGVVLGPRSGMYQKLLPLARLGINTCIGSGRQYLPWIHIDDLLSIYHHLLTRPESHGPYNIVADQTTTMKIFSKQLALSVNCKRWTPPTPKWLLRILLGELSKLASEGSRISNQKLLNTGYSFKYNTIENAINSLSK